MSPSKLIDEWTDKGTRGFRQYQRRMKAGLCVRCSKSKASYQDKCCEACKGVLRDNSKRYYINHKPKEGSANETIV